MKGSGIKEKEIKERYYQGRNFINHGNEKKIVNSTEVHQWDRFFIEICKENKAKIFYFPKKSVTKYELEE